MITAINKQTGEVIELPDGRLGELINAWQVAKDYEQMALAIRNQVKKHLPKYLSASDETEVIGAYKFKRSVVQRKGYDKAAVRNVLKDEDLVDEFLIVDKTKLDSYIKENLAELGDLSHELRVGMVDSGRPYEVIKLEQLK